MDPGTLHLEPEEEAMLRGDAGQATALAMQTLVAYGRVFGAKRMRPIRSAHLAGTFGARPYPAYYKILDRFVAEGVRVRVPTTMNPRPGETLNLVNRAIFSRQVRLDRQMEALGVHPNYSCVCYEGANVPAAGDCLAWAESSAVQFANSVLGARTNRNSVLIDLCSAVTGVTPEFGYLLEEHRRGTVLIRLDIDRVDPGALGFLIGREVVQDVPVIEHTPFSRVALKNMGGAMAAAGGVALFHVEGLTPEAPDLDTAFAGREPKRTVTITQGELDALRTPSPEDTDMIVFGCPQMTYEEALEVSDLFSGRPVKRPTWFCMIPEARKRFQETEACRKIARAGIEVHDHCPVAALTVRLGRRKVLTPSGKLFYYLKDSCYGTIEDCIRASGGAP